MEKSTNLSHQLVKYLERMPPINKLNTLSYCHDKGVHMYFDRDKVHRILYNLLNNAFKFTPPGGSITVSADTITQDGTQYICIRIEDTGKGIESEELFLIFSTVIIRSTQAKTDKPQQEAVSGCTSSKSMSVCITDSLKWTAKDIREVNSAFISQPI